MFHIYSDESRHRAERFLLLGALWVDEKNISVTEKRIEKFRNKHGYRNNEGIWVDFLGEFKWTKVSDKYLHVYKELVDIFFDMIDENRIRFCTMLVDIHNPTVQKYNNLKKDGYFKLLYQLYFHNCRVPGIYKIYPDKITNPRHKVDLETLRVSLDKSLIAKFENLLNPKAKPESFVENITPIDSKKVQFIQMIDVIIGAIGYFQNRHFKRPNAKKAKINLYILELSKSQEKSI